MNMVLVADIAFNLQILTRTAFYSGSKDIVPLA